MKRALPLLVILAVLLSGCSIKKMAVNSIGNGLAGSGGSFASDDDIQLVKDATPFSLKLIESLLDMVPDNRNLLMAACKNFTMYSYAFVEADADKLEESDYNACLKGRTRAKKLYLRALGYGLRGLEVSHKGLDKAARKGGEDLKKALLKTNKKDVELLYWTGMCWAAAVNRGKDDPALVADLASAEALVFRAFDLEPDFDNGAIHSFLITYMGGRSEAMGGSKVKAKEHFEKAVELTGGLSAGPYVSWAETMSVSAQDKKDFRAALKKALAIDVDKKPEWRLQNLIYQERARWLLTREKELFLD
jgi:predicted anti-sigma-YlaC factor YlaD